MVFYKGGVSYKELQEMPFPELLELKAHADRINKEIKAEQDKQSRGSRGKF